METGCRSCVGVAGLDFGLQVSRFGETRNPKPNRKGQRSTVSNLAFKGRRVYGCRASAFTGFEGSGQSIKWEFPRIRGTLYFGLLIIRIPLFRVQY